MAVREKNRKTRPPKSGSGTPRILGLQCRECGRVYPSEVLFVCEYCFGSLEVHYNYDQIKKQLSRSVIQSRPKTLWRYKELLPLEGEPKVGHHAGFTPLFPAPNLARLLGIKEIFIKDDSVNHPTLSFKDRLVSVAVSKAMEFGFSVVACASTGNLANSVAAHAAQAGLKSYIFIPADLELGKIIGTLIFKPTLVAVEGDYDEVNRLCAELAGKYQWAFVNVNIRPYYAEGSKTYVYEIVEQLGWRAPDHIVVPVGGASLLTKIWKGLKELKSLGLLSSFSTRIHAAQGAGAAPVVTAIKEKSEIIKPVRPRTIAKSIAIGNPADGYYAVDAVRQSGGTGEEAQDQEVVEGIKLLAQTEGVFTETAGGVTVAVTKKLAEKGVIGKNESVVICITGNGLKTQEAVQSDVGKPLIIKPSLASFEEHVKL